MASVWDAPITQGFGPTDEPLDGAYGGYDHFNKGLDFGAPAGTPVSAAVGGTVISAGDSGDGWGLSVKIRDANGNTHNYGHLSSIDVQPGQTVSSGANLGAVGSTGRSTGPHLSYDVWTSDGTFIDPSSFVSGGGGGGSGSGGAVNGRADTSGGITFLPGGVTVMADTTGNPADPLGGDGGTKAQTDANGNVYIPGGAAGGYWWDPKSGKIWDNQSQAWHYPGLPSGADIPGFPSGTSGSGVKPGGTASSSANGPQGSQGQLVKAGDGNYYWAAPGQQPVPAGLPGDTGGAAPTGQLVKAGDGKYYRVMPDGTVLPVSGLPGDTKTATDHAPQLVQGGDGNWYTWDPDNPGGAAPSAVPGAAASGPGSPGDNGYDPKTGLPWGVIRDSNSPSGYLYQGKPVNGDGSLYTGTAPKEDPKLVQGSDGNWYQFNTTSGSFELAPGLPLAQPKAQAVSYGSPGGGGFSSSSLAKILNGGSSGGGGGSSGPTYGASDPDAANRAFQASENAKQRAFSAEQAALDREQQEALARRNAAIQAAGLYGQRADSFVSSISSVDPAAYDAMLATGNGAQAVTPENMGSPNGTDPASWSLTNAMNVPGATALSDRLINAQGQQLGAVRQLRDYAQQNGAGPFLGPPPSLPTLFDTSNVAQLAKGGYIKGYAGGGTVPSAGLGASPRTDPRSPALPTFGELSPAPTAGYNPALGAMNPGMARGPVHDAQPHPNGGIGLGASPRTSPATLPTPGSAAPPANPGYDPARLGAMNPGMVSNRGPVHDARPRPDGIGLGGGNPESNGAGPITTMPITDTPDDGVRVFKTGSALGKNDPMSINRGDGSVPSGRNPHAADAENRSIYAWLLQQDPDFLQHFADNPNIWVNGVYNPNAEPPGGTPLTPEELLAQQDDPVIAAAVPWFVEYAHQHGSPATEANYNALLRDHTPMTKLPVDTPTGPPPGWVDRTLLRPNVPGGGIDWQQNLANQNRGRAEENIRQMYENSPDKENALFALSSGYGLDQLFGLPGSAGGGAPLPNTPYWQNGTLHDNLARDRSDMLNAWWVLNAPDRGSNGLTQGPNGTKWWTASNGDIYYMQGGTLMKKPAPITLTATGGDTGENPGYTTLPASGSGLEQGYKNFINQHRPTPALAGGGQIDGMAIVGDPKPGSNEPNPEIVIAPQGAQVIPLSKLGIGLGDIKGEGARPSAGIGMYASGGMVPGASNPKPKANPMPTLPGLFDSPASGYSPPSPTTTPETYPGEYPAPTSTPQPTAPSQPTSGDKPPPFGPHKYVPDAGTGSGSTGGTGTGSGGTGGAGGGSGGDTGTGDPTDPPGYTGPPVGSDDWWDLPAGSDLGDVVRGIRTGVTYRQLNPRAADWEQIDPTIRARYYAGVQAKFGIPTESQEFDQKKFALRGLPASSIGLGF